MWCEKQDASAQTPHVVLGESKNLSRYWQDASKKMYAILKQDSSWSRERRDWRKCWKQRKRKAVWQDFVRWTQSGNTLMTGRVVHQNHSRTSQEPFFFSRSVPGIRQFSWIWGPERFNVLRRNLTIICTWMKLQKRRELKLYNYKNIHLLKLYNDPKLENSHLVKRSPASRKIRLQGQIHLNLEEENVNIRVQWDPVTCLSVWKLLVWQPASFPRIMSTEAASMQVRNHGAWGTMRKPQRTAR